MAYRYVIQNYFREYQFNSQSLTPWPDAPVRNSTARRDKCAQQGKASNNRFSQVNNVAIFVLWSFTWAGYPLLLSVLRRLFARKILRDGAVHLSRS